MLNRSLYIFLAQVSGYATRMVLPMFLVRTLTKAEYGMYSQFFLVEALIDMLFQLGSNQALYYYVPRDEKNAGAYFINSLLLNVILFTSGNAIVGLFRHEVADLMGMPVIATMFWQLFMYTTFLMLGTSAECYLISRRNVKQGAIYIFSRHLLISIVTLWAAYRYRSVEAIITALVVARLLSVIGILLYVHIRIHGFRAERYFVNFWSQFRYGVLLGLSGIMWALLMRMHQIAVTKLYDIEVFAVYSVGLRQIPVLMLYNNSVSAVMMSEFTRLEKDRRWQEINTLWNDVVARLYGVGVPITVFFLLIAQPLVTTLFTQEYGEAVPIFRINTIAMMYLLLNPTLVLRAMDRNDITLKVQAGVLAVCPFLLYAGYRTLGLLGIISAHAVLVNSVMIVSMIVLNRMLPVHLDFFPHPRRVLKLYSGAYHQVRDKGLKILRRGKTPGI